VTAIESRLVCDVCAIAVSPYVGGRWQRQRANRRREGERETSDHQNSWYRAGDVPPCCRTACQRILEQNISLQLCVGDTAAAAAAAAAAATTASAAAAAAKPVRGSLAGTHPKPLLMLTAPPLLLALLEPVFCARHDNRSAAHAGMLDGDSKKASAVEASAAAAHASEINPPCMGLRCVLEEKRAELLSWSELLPPPARA